MHILLHITPIINFLEQSKYFLLVIGTFFEGPIVMTTSGFLWHMGKFNFLPMYIILVITNAIADTIWYLVGYFGARPIILKYGKFFHITPEIMGKVEKDFHKYHSKILIINKLTSGFVVLVLLFAGMTKVPFKKYALINLLGGLIFVLLLVCIGYVFGNIYIIIPQYLKAIFLILVIFSILFGFRKMKKYYLSTNL